MRVSIAPFQILGEPPVVFFPYVSRLSKTN
jgi:hypothetical protein